MQLISQEQNRNKQIIRSFLDQFGLRHYISARLFGTCLRLTIMIKVSTFLKLAAVCAFFWVQATQIDHYVDDATNSDHPECLVCQTLGDPTPADEATLTVSKLVFNSNTTTRVSIDLPLARSENADPARAPPFSI